MHTNLFVNPSPKKVPRVYMGLMMNRITIKKEWLRAKEHRAKNASFHRLPEKAKRRKAVFFRDEEQGHICVRCITLQHPKIIEQRRNSL